MPGNPSATDALRWTLLAALGLPSAAGCGQTSAGGSGTGGTTSLGLECTEPTQPVPGQDTGVLLCQQGFGIRTRPVECSSIYPRDTDIPPGTHHPGAGGFGGAGDYEDLADECLRDSDCAPEHACFVTQYGLQMLPDGTTEPGPPSSGNSWGTYNRCVALPSCRTDADCTEQQLCECGSAYGRCVDAACRSDADCTRGARCLRSEHFDGCSTRTAWSCESPEDSCRSDADCPEGQSCAPIEGGFTPRSCRGYSCVVGRPFLVAESLRLAPVVPSSAWLIELEGLGWGPLELEDLDEGTRRRLGDHWARVGAMEHASIYAFARFWLQLLSLDAPQELLVAARTAQADEDRHARLCFSLASRYLGHDVGAGHLSLAGALDDLSLEGILVTTLLEGCVGETRAALEAARAAESCESPVVRAILERIHAEESQHAELAWRTVGFVLDEYPELIELAERTLARARLEGAFVAQVAEGDSARPGGHSARPEEWELARHGLLGERERRSVEREAWRSVIVPTWTALRLRLEPQPTTPTTSGFQRAEAHAHV
ncbi:MAG TPA: ferritin-like domain-containing protein [Polyangiaceae bacterium]|nr:ferritin-like domain-containing protein [Polyangiaceae bacterium]